MSADRSAPPIRLRVVSGNPKPGSRTLGVATRLAEALAVAVRGAGPPDVVDLPLHGQALIGAAPDELGRLIATVTTADVLVVATPVYKGAYTGLLKLLLDRLPGGGLSGTVAVPVTVAAAATHRFAADLQLRPVLTELGASVPVPSLTLEESDLPGLDVSIEQWISAHAPVVGAVSAAATQQRAA